MVKFVCSCHGYMVTMGIWRHGKIVMWLPWLHGCSVSYAFNRFKGFASA